MVLPLYNWMRKHGIEHITYTVLSLHANLADLDLAEIVAIERHGTHVSRGGLNVTPGGDGGRGFKHSVETRVRMSIAHTGKAHSAETVAKRAAANTGSRRTPEQRQRIAESITGRKLSAEHKLKLAKKLTSEQADRIREMRDRRDLTQSQIGALFGVSRITVNRILRGRSRA